MKKSIGFFLLQIAVALYLFATGIIGMGGGRQFLGFRFDNSEIRQAVAGLFGNGGFTDFLVIILAVCAIAAGVFLLLELFGVQLKITSLLLLILIIVWVVFILLFDIIRPLQSNFGNFVDYLRTMCPHVMVLGSMLCASKQFGGK